MKPSKLNANLVIIQSHYHKWVAFEKCERCAKISLHFLLVKTDVCFLCLKASSMAGKVIFATVTFKTKSENFPTKCSNQVFWTAIKMPTFIYIVIIKFYWTLFILGEQLEIVNKLKFLLLNTMLKFFANFNGRNTFKKTHTKILSLLWLSNQCKCFFSFVCLCVLFLAVIWFFALFIWLPFPMRSCHLNILPP